MDKNERKDEHIWYVWLGNVRITAHPVTYDNAVQLKTSIASEEGIPLDEFEVKVDV